MDTRLSIVYFLIILIMSQVTLRQSNIFAKQSTSDTANIKIKSKDVSKEERSQNEMLLNYIQSVQKAESEHRTYIRWFYTILGSVITFIITALSAIIVFLNKRSTKEIKESVDDAFHREIKTQFKNKLESIERHLDEQSNTSDSFFNALARVIIETSSNSSEQEPFDERKLAKKNILWVDDKQFNIRGYKYLLKSLGINVTPATTTAEALEHLGSNIHFHLIISNMGREDGGSDKTAGLGLIEKVDAGKIPIVIFTRPDKINEYRERVITLGAHDVVSGISGILNAIVKILT